MGAKIVAIVGSYRKDGVIDTAVEAVLAGAREKGANTHTIYLTEHHIEFCRNCRTCVQTPGQERGSVPSRTTWSRFCRRLKMQTRWSSEAR